MYIGVLTTIDTAEGSPLTAGGSDTFDTDTDALDSSTAGAGISSTAHRTSIVLNPGDLNGVRSTHARAWKGLISSIPAFFAAAFFLGSISSD
jgi:hypothetical protein